MWCVTTLLMVRACSVDLTPLIGIVSIDLSTQAGMFGLGSIQPARSFVKGIHVVLPAAEV